ncbi:MFS transporter [Phaeacidiphilus oryzae]|uniref:MFS transporter n=1 Tax=Phaeacidiphilus oryzae TaxID=348818 RepID=UPI0005647526|nr:MFS transporter [Phaeacidiphilus oryzae]
MADSTPAGITAALDEAPLSRFHTRAVITAGMGFFTDAYDLFIVGTASTLIAAQWHLSTSQTGLVNSMTLLAAFIGAFVFGRIADLAGRKKVYGLEASLMVVGAVASAFAPNLVWLLVFRFILGIGVGGDYPVSAVLMSEYANRRDRGKLVGLVFSMQALGTVAGYIAGLVLLSTGMSHDLTWRLLLGLGAVPAACVIYLRHKMPESPRYTERVRGDSRGAAANLNRYADGAVHASAGRAPGTAAPAGETRSRLRGLRTLFADRRNLKMLIGTAGTWFVFDYAYYGNSVSAPLIVKSVLGGGNHPTTQVLALNLIVFSIAAIPGYYLATAFMDRIGHRRLQLIGFACMGLAFLLIGVIPGITTMVVPFLLLFGLSYFFAEFGPNTTTFVLSAECFPTSIRSTAHGISSGVAKIGAFIGVFLFPVIQKALGTAGALELSAGFALVGILLTLLIPETSQRSLDEVSEEQRVVAEAERIAVGAAAAEPR